MRCKFYLQSSIIVVLICCSFWERKNAEWERCVSTSKWTQSRLGRLHRHVVLHEHSPTIAAQAFFPFIEFSNKLSLNVFGSKGASRTTYSWIQQSENVSLCNGAHRAPREKPYNKRIWRENFMLGNSNHKQNERTTVTNATLIFNRAIWMGPTLLCAVFAKHSCDAIAALDVWMSHM